MLKKGRKNIIRNKARVKGTIITMLFLLCFYSCYSQKSTDISSKVLKGRSVYNIVLGNLLSKITYEQVLNLNQSSFVGAQNLSEHLLDTTKYYRLWFKDYNNDFFVDYDLYEYSGFPQFYLRRYNEDLVGMSPSFTYYSPLMEKGLIGLHKKTSQLIFVSGYLFLDNIKTITKIRDEKNIIEYIKIRYFNYSPSEIIIHTENESVATASFDSEVTGKRYMVKIPFEGNDELWTL